MTVPESPEVIEQESKTLVRLYTRSLETGAEENENALRLAIGDALSQPKRALRLAELWGYALVDPVRGDYDLSDPESGIYFFSQATGRPPHLGAAVAGEFLTAILKNQPQDAHACFLSLAADDRTNTHNLLCLLLALYATRKTRPDA